MSGWILLPPILQKFKEFLGTPLLEQTHQRTLNRLQFRARYFGDLTIAINEAARDLLELKVSSDISVDEYLGQLSGSDDELWY